MAAVSGYEAKARISVPAGTRRVVYVKEHGGPGTVASVRTRFVRRSALSGTVLLLLAVVFSVAAWVLLRSGSRALVAYAAVFCMVAAWLLAARDVIAIAAIVLPASAVILAATMRKKGEDKVVDTVR